MYLFHVKFTEIDPTDMRNGNFGRYAGRRNPQHFPTLVDNPEYQLMSREYTNVPQMPPLTPDPLAYAPIGLPPINSGAPGSSAGSGNHSIPPGTPMSNYAQSPSYINNNLQRPGSMVRHSSRSEEESDHEYYNEVDRLKREMQPLHQMPRKSETTV